VFPPKTKFFSFSPGFQDYFFGAQSISQIFSADLFFHLPPPLILDSFRYCLVRRPRSPFIPTCCFFLISHCLGFTTDYKKSRFSRLIEFFAVFNVTGSLFFPNNHSCASDVTRGAFFQYLNFFPPRNFFWTNFFFTSSGFLPFIPVLFPKVFLKVFDSPCLPSN